MKINPELGELIGKRERWVEANQENEFDIEGILSGLYDDPSHLVYEILQNAEDVGANRVKFTLKEDMLKIAHNGENFLYSNVDAITGIGKSTKKDDLTSIGKFGVGFKSVFAITTLPGIHSHPYYFNIKNFVVPDPYSPSSEIENNKQETVIILPFNHPGRTPDYIYSNLQKRLSELGLETLMFLSNIDEIICCIDGHRDTYIKDNKGIKDGFRTIQLSHKKGDETNISEKWIIVGKSILDNDTIEKEINKIIQERGEALTNEEKEKLKVEIAFKVEKNDNDEEYINRIDPKRSKLSAFFLTKIHTGLHFIIQGPYRTTPARDNVPFSNNWNSALVDETANLLSDSLSLLKNEGWLDINFLNTLPINSENIKDELLSLYASVKNRLYSEDELLVGEQNGDYASALSSALSRGTLHGLLNNEQLKTLFSKEKWVCSDISLKQYLELWNYFEKELDIPVIDPDKFARQVDQKFINSQTDEWMIKFYRYLIEGRAPKALWEKKKYSWQKDPILRSKPIIRREDGKNVNPFTNSGKPKVYLPPSDTRYQKYFPNTVKNIILNDEKAFEFLKEIGLHQPDRLDVILTHVLPEYRTEQQVSKEDNISHIGWILKTLKSTKIDERRNGLLSEIKKTPFLMTKQMSDGSEMYRSPNDGIYLGEIFTGKNELDIFFGGQESIWFLDERYKDLLNSEILNEFGCKSKIDVKLQKPDANGFVKKDQGWNYGNHKRGLNKFDPDCEIVGLEKVLDTITLEKSVVIWNILLEYSEQISGTVEEASTQNYSRDGRHYSIGLKDSIMGKLLKENKWLYANDVIDPLLPSELEPSKLANKYQKDDTKARILFEKLGLANLEEQKLVERLSAEKKQAFKLAEKILNSGHYDKILELLNKLKTIPEQSGDGLGQISGEVKGSLKTGKTPRKPKSLPTQAWTGMSPDDIQDAADNYDIVLEDNIDDSELVTETVISKRTSIQSKSKKTTISPKEFLREKYDGGHCQICNTLLDLGNGKKHFIRKRIVPTEHQRKWADEVWNLLCLCPNCYALVSHGRGNDFSNIPVVALSARNGEEVPETVEERSGDYYIIEITLAGRKKEIFYHPNHLVKLGVLMKKSKKE